MLTKTFLSVNNCEDFVRCDARLGEKLDVVSDGRKRKGPGQHGEKNQQNVADRVTLCDGL